tara:strand:- start:946 stop:1824 length:879 start_codon:yes stop_codon:yes gene_type:complete
MIFVGFVIGTMIGVLSGLIFHGWVTTSFIIWKFSIWLIVNAIVVWLFYLIGKIGYSSSAVIASDIIFPENTYRFPRFKTEKFAFGFFVGMCVATNFVICFFWSTIPLSSVLAFFSLLPMLALFSTLSQLRLIQPILGWCTWIMPLAILSAPVALITALYAIPAAIIQHGKSALRVDPTSGALEIRFNFPDILVLGSVRGVSIWIFTYINTDITPLPDFGVGFLSPSVSAHESGHTLNTSIFGSFFLLINWIDENITAAPGESFYSLAELYAESRSPGTSHPSTSSYLPLWSD